MFKKITILFILISIIAGCKKYPEDPATLHLRTAKKRLVCSIWITEWTQNTNTGTYYAVSHGNDGIIFKKNGNFIGENSDLFKFNGKWEFEDKKNNIHIYNETNSFTFKIIRLDANFLHLKNDSLESYYH